MAGIRRTGSHLSCTDPERTRRPRSPSSWAWGTLRPPTCPTCRRSTARSARSRPTRPSSRCTAWPRSDRRPRRASGWSSTRASPTPDRYDVLHIDLNADGDLTGPGERLTPDEDGRFHVADFKDPATGVKHPDFTVRLSKDTEPTVMLSLRWRGQFNFGGGYPEDPEGGYMRFAAQARRRAGRLGPRRRAVPLPALVRRQAARRRGRGLQGLPGPAGRRPQQLLRRPGALPARGRVGAGDADLPRRDGQGAAAGLRAQGALLRDAPPRPGPGPQ